MLWQSTHLNRRLYNRSNRSNNGNPFYITNENMNLKKLAEQMGTSVNMIDKHYGHLDFEAYGGEMAVKSVVKSLDKG